MLRVVEFLTDNRTPSPKYRQRELEDETLGDRAALFYGAARLEYT